MSEFSDDDLLRYSRQILLPQIDVEGQQKIAATRCAVVGAGGLGSVVAPYLWAAGVGEIHLFDDDEVDISNLHRQLMHQQASVASAKVTSAEQSLLAIRDEPGLFVYKARAGDDLLADQKAALARCDIILDCSDNFDTRHWLNQFAVEHKRALVSGAAVAFDGQVSVFDRRRDGSACYACVFGEVSGAADNCSSQGVLGPIVGIIGAAQALQALLLMSEQPNSLHNRLAVFDGANFTWRTIKINRDEQCSICGQ